MSSETETLPEVFSISAFYPNPAKNGANLDISLPETRPTTVTFIDVTGRVVSRSSFSGRAGRQRMEFDTSHLPAGTYFVRIEAGAEAVTRRITVIR